MLLVLLLIVMLLVLLLLLVMLLVQMSLVHLQQAHQACCQCSQEYVIQQHMLLELMQLHHLPMPTYW